jgi:hypothetical protein
VLVAVGHGLPLAAYAGAARLGVWSLRHGTEGGLREVLEAQPATATVLEARSKGVAPKTILRSFGSTDPVSIRRNLNPLCWKGAAFVLRTLRDLSLKGSLEPLPPEAPPPSSPETGNLATAALLLRHSTRYVSRKLKDLVSNEQWYMAYRFEDAPRDGFEDLLEIMPPKDRYWADPFPVRTEEGRFFLFFEELRYSDPKGTLHALELDPRKGPGKPFPVLERPYHLSYPQVFRFEGRYYMLPESSANRTVTLFRCESFPDRWVEEKDLLRDLDAVDATLAEVDGRWWMFVNVSPFGAGNKDELHLYQARTPLGPWTPHGRNPVKSDCRSARPAGSLYRRPEGLYRPAQDCAGSYGSAIVLHRVDELSPDAYRETPVARIVPTWDRKALRAHTINRCDGLLVLDLLRRRRRWL